MRGDTTRFVKINYILSPAYPWTLYMILVYTYVALNKHRSEVIEANKSSWMAAATAVRPGILKDCTQNQKT